MNDNGIELNVDAESDFNEELEYAEMVTGILLQKIEEESVYLSKRREKVIEDRRYFSDYFSEMKEDERNDWLQSEHSNIKAYDVSKVALTRYTKQLGEPYFARVDFTESGRNSEKKVYIGVGNIMHDCRLYVYDWRAPISSLYYECEIGPGAYTAPGGKVEGEVKRKKKFVFEGGRLCSAVDINMPSDDEFLIGILSRHADGKMRTIIDSLQKEQSRIVRGFIDGVYVIQGCAGSGKTSVALHKIAYIMYSFRDRLKNSEIVVLSPNSSFSSYIANVLPDLGEDNVSQLTQEELIKAIAYDCGFSYADRGTSFERVLASMDERLIAAMKLKNSRLFKRILDLYCKYFERTCFRPKPLFLDEDGDEFVTAEDLDFLFHSEFETSEVMKRPPLMVKYIARKNRIKDKDVLDELENQIYDMLSTCDFTQIYSGIYNDKAFFDSLDSEIKETVGEFGKYQVLPYAWEDGCAVAYLRIILAGLEQPENVFYFFADEAQDLSPVMLGVIKAAYGSADMLFAGDFAQNVFCCGEDYTESIKYNFVGKHYKKYELSVNYRSTKEISDFAGSEAGFERDISCIRRGPEPELIRASGNVAEQVSEWIKRMDEMGFVSAAVICTSRVEADNLAIDTVLPCHMKLNVRFLPVYIAKGLEYDCVLVINKDGEMRSKDKILNTNMLYTAYTRAMHCLAVIE